MTGAPRDGERSSDEMEIDHLRLEVDRLRRLVTAAAAALDGLLTDVGAPGLPVHPLVVFHLRRLAHDLRAVLDQGAP